MVRMINLYGHWRGILTSHIQVAIERIKEFSEIKREPPEFVEPRPPASWPSNGTIKCEDLVIRYAVREILRLSTSMSRHRSSAEPFHFPFI